MIALIVDDDAVARMALADLLAGYDMFDLVEADDGEAAWTLLEGGLTPVVCFCDVRMPRMTGLELLQKIKSHPTLAALPFVLVSSASDRDTVLQAVKLGAVGYLLKPLMPAEARPHLEKIFRLTVDKLAESPAASMARLNVGAARLLAYLDAFAAQLVQARAELGPMLGAGRVQDALHRVETVRNGCSTLGLWQAAAALAGAGAGIPDAARLEHQLAAVAETVARQTRRVRAAAAVHPVAP